MYVHLRRLSNVQSVVNLKYGIYMALLILFNTFVKKTIVMTLESKARYTPFIGKKYFTGINKDKFLFIGGHHSCMMSERESKYKCNLQEICGGTDDVECPAYNRLEEGCPLYHDCVEPAKTIKDYNNPKLNDECQKRIKLTCETIYSVWDYIEHHTKRRPNFIFNAIETFRKELGTEIGEFEFYQYLAFANYVQIITSNERNSPEDPIKMEDLEHKDNLAGFESNYNFLEPDIIVVIHFEQIKEIIENKLPNMHHGGEKFTKLEGKGNYFIFAKKDSNLYRSRKFSIARLNKYSKFIEEASLSGYTQENIASAIAYHNKENNNIKYIETYRELNEKYGYPLPESLQKTCNSYIKRIKNDKKGQPLKCYKELDNYFKEQTK